jgi:serine protease Do
MRSFLKKIILTFLILLMTSSCQFSQQEGMILSKKVIKKIYPGIVEVVVPKNEDKFITYKRPLPFEKQDYKQRKDNYHSIGTAFFINKQKLLSAAHVLGADEFSLRKNFFIRDHKGAIHKIKTIYRYSQYRDVVEFDLETYPESFSPLKVKSQVEMGDMVYSVGNAQGEGISVRGGQVSSFTPEQVNGKWKFLRFSSPASPGNSGGPLVNARGKVVGVIVMKNQSENLNYALPIDEVQNTSLSKANFFLWNRQVKDGTQVVSQSWKENVALPSTLEALRKMAIPSKSSFYKKLIQEFKKQNKNELFPYHPRWREYLRFQVFPNIVGRIDKNPNFSQWTVVSSKSNETALTADQTIYSSKGDIFSFELLIEKPKSIPLINFFNHKKGLMDAAIKVLGPARHMAGESIPIISYGDPVKTENWRDRFDRPWSSSFWHVQYNNTYHALHCTPSPGASFCFLDTDWAGNLNEGYIHFVKDNILEQPLTYSGSLKEWEEYLNLPKKMRPSYFNSLSIKRHKKTLHFTSSNFSFRTSALKISEDTELMAQVGYSLEEFWKMNVFNWVITEKKFVRTGLKITRFIEPSPLNKSARPQLFQDIILKRGRFDGKIHQKAGGKSSNLALTSVQKLMLQQKSGKKEVQALYLATCFDDARKPVKWPKSTCEALKKSFKVKTNL